MIFFRRVEGGNEQPGGPGGPGGPRGPGGPEESGEAEGEQGGASRRKVLFAQLLNNPERRKKELGK